MMVKWMQLIQYVLLCVCMYVCLEDDCVLSWCHVCLSGFSSKAVSIRQSIVPNNNPFLTSWLQHFSHSVCSVYVRIYSIASFYKRTPTPTGAVQQQDPAKAGGRSPHQRRQEEQLEETPLCVEGLWPLLFPQWQIPGQSHSRSIYCSFYRVLEHGYAVWWIMNIYLMRYSFNI